VAFFVAEQLGDTRTFNPGVGESSGKDISAEHKARYPTLGRRFHLLFSPRLTQTSTEKPHLDPVSAFGPFSIVRTDLRHQNCGISGRFTLDGFSAFFDAER